MFDEAYADTVKLLRADSFVRWCHSDDYKGERGAFAYLPVSGNLYPAFILPLQIGLTSVCAWLCMSSLHQS